MADRHRGDSRSFDRSRNRGPIGGGPGGGGRERRGDSGPGYGREGRDFGGPPPFRERRPAPPPPAPAPNEHFEDVEAILASSILQAATKLTEIVGTAGLPDELPKRREAVMETFEAIYFAVLDAVTGEDEEDEEL